MATVTAVYAVIALYFKSLKFSQYLAENFFVYLVLQPPSMINSSPVTNFDSSDAK